ncbi:MAG: response regulator [Oscillospiraceae bacterium]|nr:response regulator [Oscillospiraceae bacterium]
MLRAMIADDEPAVGKLIRYFLNEEQMPIQIIAEVNDGQAALNAILTQHPDLVFLDIQMPLMNGLDVIERAKQEHSTTKFIVITAYSIFEYAQSALRLGADDLLLKPINGEQLIAAINRAVGMQFSSNRQVNDILLYLGEHLGESLTLNDIAEKFYISSYHLSHLFKKYMGMTCIECVHWMRIEKARQLLKNTNMSIKEISELTGYSNLNNFYMHFKKLTGMTPKSYITRSGSAGTEED